MDEVKRLQKLAGINEIKVNNPNKQYIIIDKEIENLPTSYYRDDLKRTIEGMMDRFSIEDLQNHLLSIHNDEDVNEVLDELLDEEIIQKI